MTRPPIGEPPSSLTRARARARELEGVIAEIARRIIDGSWTPEAQLALAERENVRPHRVSEWAAEAARSIRVLPAVEEYRAINLRRLDETYEKGDSKVKVAAVSEQNKMLGLHAPTMHKVDVSVQAYAKLSDVEMLEHVETQIARLEELRTKLLAKSAVPALPVGTEDDDERDE